MFAYNMKTPLVSVAVAVLLTACSGRGIADRSLEELDGVIAFKETYEQAFLSKMETMKSLVGEKMSAQERYRLNAGIAEGYSYYSYDSTMAYLDRNLKLAQEISGKEWIVETRLLKAREYLQAGYHVECAAVLKDVGYDQVPESLKKLYFTVRHSLAGELMAYSRGEELYLKNFYERNEMRDSLMHYIEPDSYEYYDLNRESALTDRDSSAVRKFASAMIRLSDVDSRKYAKACWFYSQGVPKAQTDSVLYWLCKSAAADVKCATKDYAALNFIAMKVFAKGDVARAFRYVANHCMPDALSFNGKLRPWQVARFFVPIELKYEALQKRQSTIMQTVSVTVSLLLVLLGFMLMKDRRQRRMLLKANDELKSLNAKIVESDKVKEEYISLFLGIVSDNINKNRKHQNHVLKYLRRGNARYIEEELEMMPPIEEDIRTFYKMFDETFLNLYPGFVEKFNALMADGEQIEPKEQDVLTPELRVFALIRLGVTDSGKIASMLHYSANTVYNYRAKIKNRARGPRDKFEEAVRNI